MHFDLFTLYVLAIGTLLVSAGMTAWERQALRTRRRELGGLTAGYLMLALGCAVATVRTHGGVAGYALSNLIILTGYLLILDSVAAPGGNRYRASGAALLAVVAAAWAIGGTGAREAMWNYGSALPIGLVSALTAWEALRSEPMRPFAARRIVAAVAGLHAVLYFSRALVLPVLTARYGADVLTVAGKITMYDGVLYSVCLPMALLALMREEAHRQILDVSHTDYLTGLATRRWFFEEAARLLRRADANRPATLLVFDLDHFKSVNDLYGHATGDEVLRVFARIVRETIGIGAIGARLGGEEFAALLPGIDGTCGRLVGQSIARQLADTVIQGERGARFNATVSVGLSEYRLDAHDIAELLSAADRALYLAKTLGRNRVEAAPPRVLHAAA